MRLRLLAPGGEEAIADLVMLGLAGMGVAFRAKPRVAAAARLNVAHGDLTALLFLQGYARGTSPALERRAAQGVVFERALSTSSWTLPSFGSLLTGRLPARHAAGLRLARPGEVARLGDDVGTLAELMRARGYATAARVTNPYLDDRFGLARGFDSYRNEPVSNRRIRRAASR